MLIVHPYDMYDSLRIAEQGINSTLDVKAGRFNVLQLNDLLCTKEAPYVQLDPANCTYNNVFGLLFSRDMLSHNRVLFDGVSDYIITGGGIKRCLDLAFMSILAVKSGYPDDKFLYLFGKHDSRWRGALPGIGSRAWYFHEKDKVSRLRIRNGEVLNVHFNLEGCYAHSYDLNWRSTDNQALRRFSELIERTKRETLESGFPDFRRDIHKVMFRELVLHNRELLEGSGFDVREYLNGIASRIVNGSAQARGTTINLYYWISTAAMAEHFDRTGDEAPKEGINIGPS